MKYEICQVNYNNYINANIVIYGFLYPKILNYKVDKTNLMIYTLLL